MLKIILPLLSLITIIQLSNYWWITIASLFIITLIASINITRLHYTNLSITPISSIDTISSTLLILRILIAALIIIARSKIINSKNKHKLFSIINVLLLIILINCFSASNIIIFYIWFEASLIPTIIIIITWGYQPERLQASIYLILYTITASLPIFIIFCSIFIFSNHILIPISSEIIFPHFYSLRSIFWIITIVGFLVKLPIFSTHLWLPKAHVEAPIAGSIVLAAILLKLGGYGLARISILFQSIVSSSSAILIRISITGAIATSLICIRQPDLKSLIAYSSVGHIGLILTGILSNSSWGITGRLIIIVAHGLRSSALFIIANLSYEITHTRSIFLTKGLITINPIITIWWFIFTAANIAAPPSINLLREITLITATLSKSIYFIPLLGLVRFLTAIYSLHIYTTTQHGQIRNYTNPLTTIKPKDILVLSIHIYPVVLFIIKPELISLWY
jgi:NADH-ubiquinone oxidoreductase chain 4